MSVEIVYAREDLVPSFRQAFDQVAKEHIYLEMIEADSLDQMIAFQNKLIEKNSPVYFAVDIGVVVGWIGIMSSSNPRLAHRGHLGMGVIKSHRRQGIGSKLLNIALEHARSTELEKVELYVYTANKPAIKLYRKYNFDEIGVIRHYRKLDGQYFDALEMELFL